MGAAAAPSASKRKFYHLPSGAVAFLRRSTCGLVLAWALLTVSGALALQTTQEHLDHGYDLLAQARHTPAEAQREQLLTTATDAFSKAYQQAGQGGKVHALIGAAQAYLLMRKAPAVFPFLWSAPPLQRAARSLQQALVLQPDNSAALLLMGLTLWRQAHSAAAPEHQDEQRSLAYLARAATLGIPIQLPSGPTNPSALTITPFGVDDTVLVVRHVDARGIGKMADLLLAYRTSKAHAGDYAVVISSGIAYPLTTPRVNGILAPEVQIDDLKMTPEPQQPIIVAVVQHEGRQVEQRFVWHESRFVFIGERPVDS
jgi:hypothetical protein